MACKDGRGGLGEGSLFARTKCWVQCLLFRLLSGAALVSVVEQSRNEIHSNLTSALKDYFDPKSGRFQERVERLIKQDGELEQVLQLKQA